MGATAKRIGFYDKQRLVINILYATAADQANQDHDDGNDEQDVDEAADGVRRDQAKQPEDNEDNSNCVQHDESPRRGAPVAL
jgi:hypothetical protein